ncbi:MAG: glycosyltransferase family 4 protein [Candidatus Riflebacteria bacterium]|nr:glycosyltransferase family 4 protein [Candidatus Riflebacteria bacterium]
MKTNNLYHITSLLRNALIKTPKVLILSTLQGTGSGIAAYRLHKNLLKAEIASTMCVLERTNSDPTVISIKNNVKGIPVLSWRHLSDYWHDLLQNYPNKSPTLCCFTTPDSLVPLESFNQDCDVINLHWISGFVDLPKIPKLFKGKKIVWTLHDMNAFTGGCHYTQKCTKYESKCSECPQLGKSLNSEDIVKDIWETKNKIYEQLEDMTIITPSRWMADCSKKSSLLGRFPHKVIPNSVDGEIFKPMSREEARIKLGLPIKKKLILFGATSLGSVRKGFELFLRIIEILPKFISPDELELVSFGSLDPRLTFPTPFKFHSLGSLNNEDDLCLAYNASDLYVMSSKEDNLPNTAVESLACGTPVVSFNIGGLTDIVDQGKTGYLAPFPDVLEMAHGIKWVLSSSEIPFRENCRKKALESFSPEKQTDAYIDVYQKVRS